MEGKTLRKMVLTGREWKMERENVNNGLTNRSEVYHTLPRRLAVSYIGIAMFPAILSSRILYTVHLYRCHSSPSRYTTFDLIAG